MIHVLNQEPSILSQYVAEIRDVEIQGDRMRFRKNLERIAEVAAFEISKVLPYTTRDVRTPLGTAKCQVLKKAPIICSILRAGLTMHGGLLNFFDGADNGFVSAYRKHGKDGEFSIELEYVACPSFEGQTLIVSDPMIATGSSMVLTIEKLFEFGTPSQTHIVSAISAKEGLEVVSKRFPDIHIWAAAVDPELNDKSYIVPGLGDAGDLAYGGKLQR